MPALVPFVSVSFGANRTEEIAYRDGAFVYPYLSSTRDGDAFSLVRTGGWPSTPTVHVEEGTAAPSTMWDVVYDVDLAAQPTQTLLGSSVGSSAGREAVVTIDGKSWTARTRSLNGAFPTSVVLTNGTGVVLTCNNSSWNGASLVSAALHLDLATQVPTWHPARATAILAHITTGAMDTLTDGAGVSSVNWSPGAGGIASTHIGAGFYTPTVAGRLPHNIIPGTPLTTVPSEYASTLGLNHTVAIVRTGTALGWGAQLPWTGSMPLLEDMTPFAQVASTSVTTLATGFAVYLSAAFGKLGTMTVHRIQVLQRRPVT